MYINLTLVIIFSSKKKVLQARNVSQNKWIWKESCGRNHYTFQKFVLYVKNDLPSFQSLKLYLILNPKVIFLFKYLNLVQNNCFHKSHDKPLERLFDIWLEKTMKAMAGVAQ